ncbi:hypothetical protein ACFFWC_05205 [Plantactinospora siamensis]|uniref:PRC-barrel domain-containing protein n=1 Tax=Plantactinospora siamensis TaxID=555372 RepID=A0ABV6NRK6_9ACTN
MQPDVPTTAQPIAQVNNGMRVVDAAGREIGTVTEVRMGDPNAVTAQDPPGGEGVLAGKVPHTEDGDEPDVPADLAARLLRSGYVRVDSRGLFQGDRYALAEQIAKVREDVVELAVPVADLAAES